MEGKIINYGNKAQREIIEGAIKVANAVKVSLGPAGKAVAISTDFGIPDISRDGSTICKSISFSDPALNMGAQLIKKAASQVESVAGDATSTTTILVKEFIEKGQRAINSGANMNEVKAGMLKAGRWMEDYIKTKAIPIDGDLEKIRKVATISANNDPEVGNLIVEGMSKVGINGVITADMASGLDTVIDTVVGMKLDRGWVSPNYATEEDGTCVMENCYVMVVGEKISNVAQIANILGKLSESGRPFLIVCDDIDENVNLMLLYNTTVRGAIRCCVVKGVDFGDSRKNIMEDIAVATGATHLCKENGVSLVDATLEHLGAAEKIVVSRDSTIIYQGQGDPTKIQDRANIIKSRLGSPDISDYDKTKFEKRLASLAGGIAVIKVGGATDAEKKNRKQTVDDAILASKCAISEGCVPGSGYIYLKGAKEANKDAGFWKTLEGDEKLGAEIVFSSLPTITRTVAENAGAKSDVILETVEKSKRENYGFNAKTKKFCNLIEDGILDSAKVIRVALEVAISTASMILLVDCSIVDEPTKEDK